MTTRETLIAARALIDTPEKWCGDGWEAQGRICAVHALVQVEGFDSQGNIGITEAYRALSRSMNSAQVGYWNDTHTHAEVMAAFDRAIATASVAQDKA